MIKISVIEGRNAPRFHCQQCGKVIEKAGEGAVVYPSSVEEGATSEAMVVHKDFAGSKCMSQAEAQIRSKGGSPGWEELKSALAYLVHNLGAKGKDLDEKLEQPTY
jgi:hypothetical protein